MTVFFVGIGLLIIGIGFYVRSSSTSLKERQSLIATKKADLVRLHAELEETWDEMNQLRVQLSEVTVLIKKSEARDVRVRCAIRGSSIIEQIEGYMNKAEELICKIKELTDEISDEE